MESTGRSTHGRYQDYRAQQAKLEAEKLARRKAREEKIAKGEDPGRDPDAAWGPSGTTVFRTLIIMLLMTAYAGHFVTGDWKWGYESKWLTMRHYASLYPVSSLSCCSIWGGVLMAVWDVLQDGVQKAYTEAGLLKYDGTDPQKPLLLAVSPSAIVSTENDGRSDFGIPH